MDLPDGSSITVLDTPGWHDTSCSYENLLKEISKSIEMASPGPHLFLFVVSIRQRFTDEDNTSANLFFKHFGDEVSKQTIVLFIGTDSLEDDQSIENYLERAPASLKNLVAKCYHRYFTISNKSRSNDKILDLLYMIDQIIDENGGEHYTSEMYQAHVDRIKRQEAEIKRKKEEERRRQTAIEAAQEEQRRRAEAEIQRLAEQQRAELCRMEHERRIAFEISRRQRKWFIFL